MKSFLKIAAALLFVSIIINLNFVAAQQKMSLQQCIDFAFENSFTVKQKLLEKQQKYIQLQSTKTSIAPSLGANIGQTVDFGRSALADAVIVNTTQATTSLGVGLNIDVFRGLKTHNQMKSDKLDLQATLYDIESAKENIELTITAYYLQILLNKEMLAVLDAQIILDQEQVRRIEVWLKNGKSSEAELYAAKSTLANDQLTVIETQNAVRLAKLDLAQLINYSDVSQFDIVTENDGSAIDEILNKNIDVQQVANHALQHRPAINAALTRIEKAKRDIKITQSGWSPTLSFSANFNTGFYYRFKEIALAPNEPFGLQFKNNARESIGLSLYIPLFDKLSTHYNVKLQRINVLNYELQLAETKRTLIKEIEQAYTNALASKEKYLASQIAESASEIAFKYEEIKYNEGASTNYEYNESKNKYLKSTSNLIQAKFDFLFRVKILEFYGRN